MSSAQLQEALKRLNGEYSDLQARLRHCETQMKQCRDAIRESIVREKQQHWRKLMHLCRQGQKPSLEVVWSCAVKEEYERRGFELYQDGTLMMRISKENGDVCRTVTGERVFNLFEDPPGELW